MTLGDRRMYRDSFSSVTFTCILGLLVVCADATGMKSTAASMAVIVLRMDFIAQFDSLISYTKNRTVASKNLLFLSPERVRRGPELLPAQSRKNHAAWLRA